MQDINDRKKIFLRNLNSLPKPKVRSKISTPKQDQRWKRYNDITIGFLEKVRWFFVLFHRYIVISFPSLILFLDKALSFALHSFTGMIQKSKIKIKIEIKNSQPH